MNTEVMFSSKKDDWGTPINIIQDLEKRYGKFTLDVCASAENAKCERYFTKEQDGLKQSWQGEICWMNPPYGRTETGKWVEKADCECQTGNCIVFAILPARTDTKWFHEHVYKKYSFALLKGRVKFVGAKHGAPFPSMIVIFRKQ
jgi:phage N-6-adenine-methyltransferase